MTFFWTRWKCRSVRHLLWDYAAKRLSEGPMESVERHLADCAACRREITSLEQAQRLLSAARQVSLPAPRSDWHTLRARLQTQPAPAFVDRAQSRPVLAPMLQTAVLALLFAGLGAGTSLLSVWFTHAQEINQNPKAPFRKAPLLDPQAAKKDAVGNAVSISNVVDKKPESVPSGIKESRTQQSDESGDELTNDIPPRNMFYVDPAPNREARPIPTWREHGPIHPGDLVPHFKHYVPRPGDTPTYKDGVSPITSSNYYEPVGITVLQPDGHDGEQRWK